MSILGKKWVIKNENKGVSLIAKLLQNRGIDSAEKAESFFEATLSDLHDPALMMEMNKAVERIKKAITNKEKIMIFGDYDVDGITATAILYDFLKKAGADVHYKLPNREDDGYGLRDYFIKRFKEEKVQLIVTVDCGTSNLNEVKLANELDIDVIVTDHHTIPKKLPDAYAIVNPHRVDCKYPNKDICGSSISYKLVSALARDLWEEKKAEEYLDCQLAVVALGVVGDCMALTGENRVLVREGLKRLSARKNAGILALLEEANLSVDKITSSTIGFQIGPRINAAGRMDDPALALELLIGNLEKAAVLNQLNNKRKYITEKYVNEAMAEIEQMDQLPNIIILKSKKWQSGLLGLIANKISETYTRPTIIMQEREDEFVASMRSINGFDITSVLRELAGDIFVAFGGHAMAGGFTLLKEQLSEFMNRVEAIGKEKINPEEFINTLDIDCEVNPEDLSFETCNKISHLEPFGSHNPEPTLLLKNVQLLSIRPVGKEQEHLQFPIKHGDITISSIAFRFGKHIDKIDPAKLHDVVCNMEINEWNGMKKLQLRVIDLKSN